MFSTQLYIICVNWKYIGGFLFSSFKAGKKDINQCYQASEQTG